MMDTAKFSYVLGGLWRSMRQNRICPSCGSGISQTVDQKGFHRLLRCGGCRLLYRWPYETQQELHDFYQRNYKQAGLTTDLPDLSTLNTLMSTRFKGSAKDFSRVINLLQTLSVKSGAKVLDFGANWGYGVWQFCQAGFDAVGYEISQSRAAYSTHLGVAVMSEWSEIKKQAPYDVIFSSHVLEHTFDPAESLFRQRELLVPGGLLIAYTPNGSASFFQADPTAFHHLWGRVHPVMLDEVFVRNILKPLPIAIGAHCAEDLAALALWNRKAPWTGTLRTSEMLMIATTLT